VSATASTTPVSFKRDIAPILTRALSDGATTNNSACINCHSPMNSNSSPVPVESSIAERVACTSTSACGGREVGPSARPSSLTGWTTTTRFPSANFAMANHFDPDKAGFKTYCKWVRDRVDTFSTDLNSRHLNSKLYIKVSPSNSPTPTVSVTPSPSASPVVVSRNMPYQSSTTVTHYGYNPVRLNTTQLELIQRWISEGAVCEDE
jgi:hypothetical protein